MKVVGMLYSCKSAAFPYLIDTGIDTRSIAITQLINC